MAYVSALITEAVTRTSGRDVPAAAQKGAESDVCDHDLTAGLTLVLVGTRPDAVGAV